jgi:hypothetical protein
MLTKRERILLGRVASATCDQHDAGAVDAVRMACQLCEGGAPAQENAEAYEEVERICKIIRKRELEKLYPACSVREWLTRLRIWRYESLIESLVPASAGAGKHDSAVVTAPTDKTPYVTIKRFEHWDKSLPKSYKYPTANSIVTLHVPRLCEVANEDGVIVVRQALRRGAPGKRWVVKSCAPYSLKVVEGWCFGGRHIVARHNERGRKRAMLEAAGMVVRARRLSLKLAHPERVWLTIETSVRGGNCRVGSEAWANRFVRWLGAVGEVGAVRGDLALRYAREMQDEVNRVEAAIRAA